LLCEIITDKENTCESKTVTSEMCKLRHRILVWSVKIVASDIGLKMWFLVC